MISDIFNRIELMIRQTRERIKSCTDEHLEDYLYRKIDRLIRKKSQLKAYLEAITELNESLNEEEKW